jgi:copper resistance protein C
MGFQPESVRLRGAAGGLLLAALVTVLSLAPLSPAAAHDVIKSVEPADGSVVVSVPAVIRLTFNNTPIALGSEVLVKDENGTNQSDGAVAIVDNHVSQAVKAGAPAGRYTVIWRVVSSDSHPIEGQFTFTAGQTNSTANPGTTPLSSPSALAREPAGATGFPWALVAGGTVLAAGVLATGAYVRRRLTGNDAAEEP